MHHIQWHYRRRFASPVTTGDPLPHTGEGVHRIDIEKSFGAATAAFLQKLPSVMDCIAELNSADVRIVRVSGHVGSWDPRTKFLRIGRRCSRSLVAITLLHENHHRKEPSLLPAFGRISRAQWVKRQIGIEVNAIMEEFKAIEQIKQIGGKLTERELEWYVLYRRQGKKALHAKMKSTITSNTFERYPDYYGAMFDDLQKDHAKHCGNRAGCKAGVDHFANIERHMAYIRRRNRELGLGDDI